MGQWSFIVMATELYQRKIMPCRTIGQSDTEKKVRLTIESDELWSFVNKGVDLVNS